MDAILIPEASVGLEIQINTFKDIQKAVGGLAQYLYTEEFVFAVDEEGLCKNKGVNMGVNLFYGETLVGDVVVISREKFKELDALPYE